VDPRAGLDDVEKRKFLTLPGLKLRPLERPARSQSLYRLLSHGSIMSFRFYYFVLYVFSLLLFFVHIFCIIVFFVQFLPVNWLLAVIKHLNKLTESLLLLLL
jgi:hypothetical protein